VCLPHNPTHQKQMLHVPRTQVVDKDRDVLVKFDKEYREFHFSISAYSSNGMQCDHTALQVPRRPPDKLSSFTRITVPPWHSSALQSCTWPSRVALWVTLSWYAQRAMHILYPVCTRAVERQSALQRGLSALLTKLFSPSVVQPGAMNMMHIRNWQRQLERRTHR
jgi:hypothetical protein